MYDLARMSIEVSVWKIISLQEVEQNHVDVSMRGFIGSPAKVVRVWVFSCKEDALCVLELPQEGNHLLLGFRSQRLKVGLSRS